METQVKTQEKTQSTSKELLEFTGNWFIDAGILGFVKLMEEVYDWDLKELQERIRKEPKKVYYGYFIFDIYFVQVSLMLFINLKKRQGKISKKPRENYPNTEKN